jgi:hypothetical protein
VSSPLLINDLRNERLEQGATWGWFAKRTRPGCAIIAPEQGSTRVSTAVQGGTDPQCDYPGLNLPRQGRSDRPIQRHACGGAALSVGTTSRLRLDGLVRV